jgi:hypothetical protein
MHVGHGIKVVKPLSNLSPKGEALVVTDSELRFSK